MDEKYGFFNMVIRGQTYLNILYLLLSFPLGIFYFVFLVTMLSLGIGMIIFIWGVPILVLTLLAWYGLSAFERKMAIYILHIDIPPMSKKLEGKWWEKLLSMLKNSVTWKGLLYLFLRFPLGIFAFILVVVLVSVSLAFIATPVIYILIKTGTLPGNIYMIGGWTLTDSIIFPILAGLLGLIIGFFSLHIFNGLAYVYGLIAKVLLGSEKYIEKVKTVRKTVKKKKR